MEKKLIASCSVYLDDLIDENSVEELVEFVISLEEELSTMDFTEPLYKYFKEIMEREAPEDM